MIASKTILLTGASRGIGRCIAHALAKEQATIVGVARSQSGLDQVGAGVEAAGGKWIGIPFDISQVETLPILIKQIEELTGSIDILINNAGIEIYRAFQDYSLDELQSIISTNLIAAMELTRLLLPEMMTRNSGHIVNIASTAAKKGHPYDSVYSASKAGLLMWNDAIRQELAGTNVEISIICPGYVSDQGLLADTGIAAPKLSGTSTPEAVAIAVLKAIQHNLTEIVINHNIASVGIIRLLWALWQFFPRFGDVVYRWVGVSELNQKRIRQPVRDRSLVS